MTKILAGVREFSLLPSYEDRLVEIDLWIVGNLKEVKKGHMVVEYTTSAGIVVEEYPYFDEMNGVQVLFSGDRPVYKNDMKRVEVYYMNPNPNIEIRVGGLIIRIERFSGFSVARRYIRMEELIRNFYLEVSEGFTRRNFDFGIYFIQNTWPEFPTKEEVISAVSRAIIEDGGYVPRYRLEEIWDKMAN